MCIDNAVCCPSYAPLHSLPLIYTITRRHGAEAMAFTFLVLAVLIGAYCLRHGPALNNSFSKDPI